MDKINSPDDQFHEGNPSSGQKGTKVSADWLNSVQNEIVNLIEGAGIPLDPGNNSQALEAVQTLIADLVPDMVPDLATTDETLVGTAADQSVTPSGLNALLTKEHSRTVRNNIRGNLLDYWNGRSINILGDSISHGANVVDIPRDSWVGIFRKMCNIEYGSTNHGFVSLKDVLTNAVGTFQDIHTVAKTGAWTEVTGTAAAGFLNGFGLTSSTVGNIVNVTAPTFTRYFRVWYEKKLGAGSFNVKINGVQTAVVNTVAANAGEEGGIYWIGNYNLTDNLSGETVIGLEVAAGSVTLLGISYVDSETEFLVNNFSQSGRKIIDLSTKVIDTACCDCNALVWALGHNDQWLVTDEDKALMAGRIDDLIASAIYYGTRVIILDFCWDKARTHFVRQQLIRAATTIPGAEYIPFPDFFVNTGNPPTTASLIANCFLSDTSHPGLFGHKLIAETLSNHLGLSATSKKMAEMMDHTWRPIKLLNGWVNTFTTSNLNSASRRSGNSLQLRLYLNKTGKTSDVISVLPSIYTFPYTWRHIQLADDNTKFYAFQVTGATGANLELSNPQAATDANVKAMITIPINCDGSFSRYR